MNYRMRKSGIRLKTCKRCKAVIHENSLREYCSRCYKIVEEVFDKIREYLRKYPGATSFEMEQRLEIPIHVINNFIKEGRLIEIPNENLNIECLRCGTLLLSVYYKYCPKCEDEMKRDLLKAKESLSKANDRPSKIGKMHVNHYLRSK